MMRFMFVKKRGFTLIELLAVIGIIGLIAGILIPAVQMAKVAAQKTKARSEIHQLTAAWMQYYNDYRTFENVPEGNNKTMGQDEINCMRGESVLGNDRKFIYMEFHSEEDEFTDPWGQEYHFSLQEDATAMEADGVSVYKNVAAWSYGPDMSSSTNDNVRSWE